VAAPSMARSFFDQIRTVPDPVAFITGLTNSSPPTFETDWLDFKQQPSSDLKDPKWREMWIEALSGFANNEGGVIVWGLDARKDKTTNIDAACGISPVDNPFGVKSRLVELQRQATDPPLANTEIEAYPLPGSREKGFVVCFVPEGPFKPYRAEDGRRSQYYVRSGDSFTTLSRTMLQTLFYPRTTALFTARARLRWHLVDRSETAARDEADLQCRVTLVNTGTATAKDCFVLVRVNVDVANTLGFTSSRWEVQHLGSGQEMELRAREPLHPFRAIPLFKAFWRVAAGSSAAGGYRVVPQCAAPSFDLTVFCENHAQQVLQFAFDREEMIEKEECLLEIRPIG
jgi:hypothetical protein